MIPIIIYVGILLCFLVLGFLSRNEKTLSKKPVGGLMRLLRKMAVFLYRKRERYRRSRKKHPGSHTEEELVHRELSILHPKIRLRTEEARYYIDKLQSCLLFILAADVLAILLWISDGQNLLISPEGIIERPSYTEADRSVTAQASSTDAEGKETLIGEYELQIHSRRYTEEETGMLAKKLREALPDKIRGENRNLNYVTENLELVSSAEGYPFRISWESSDYELIDPDGTVHTDKIDAGEHGKVRLTAELSYGEWKESEDYDVLIFRKPETADQKLREAVLLEVEQREEETGTGERVQLPSVIEGVRLQWKEKKEDRSLVLFGLLSAAGILSYFGKDQELHRKIQERERQLCLDYPMVISKMTLYLGAGISMRNVFYRLGEEYQRKKETEGKTKYAYEEILIVCRELDNGILETDAYANLGKRCRTRQYSKLSTLLTSNLKKGNGELLKALQEEADHSFEERRNLARQMGEEAGTKLLFPMVIMLGITLIIIMIPAYYGFSW